MQYACKAAKFRSIVSVSGFLTIFYRLYCALPNEIFKSEFPLYCLVSLYAYTFCFSTFFNLTEILSFIRNVQNNFETVTVNNFLLFHAVKPKATACSSPIMVNESGNVSCTCQGLGGNPPADVTWYKDGNNASGTGKEEKTLILTNVSEKHRGSYNCVAQSYPSELFRDEVIVEVIVNLNCKYY